MENLNESSPLTATEVQTANAAALAAYDPSTGAEVAALNNVSQAQVRAQVDAGNVAYDAATGAELAVTDAVVDLTKADTTAIEHALNHSTTIFPGNTNLICTFTAAATANTFGAWAEIADSGATKLSAAFASASGHLTELSVESLSELDTIYMVEVAYGDAKTNITAVRFAGGTKFNTPSAVQRIQGPEVPAGEKVYYRLKTASAVADTALINIRYHVHT